MAAGKIVCQQRAIVNKESQFSRKVSPNSSWTWSLWPEAGVSRCDGLQHSGCLPAFCCSYSADLWLRFLQGLAPGASFRCSSQTARGGLPTQMPLKDVFLEIMDDMMVSVAFTQWSQWHFGDFAVGGRNARHRWVVGVKFGKMLSIHSQKYEDPDQIYQDLPMCSPGMVEILKLPPWAPFLGSWSLHATGSWTESALQRKFEWWKHR